MQLQHRSVTGRSPPTGPGSTINPLSKPPEDGPHTSRYPTMGTARDWGDSAKGCHSPVLWAGSARPGEGCLVVPSTASEPDQVPSQQTHSVWCWKQVVSELPFFMIFPPPPPPSPILWENASRLPSSFSRDLDFLKTNSEKTNNLFSCLFS